MALLELGENGAMYLGYRLALSPAQCRLLAALANSDTGLDTAALARAAQLAHGTVAAAVRAVNEKAAVIGGRTLIAAGRGEGYRLARFL